ncbi:MAG: UDP-N-acetylmuramoyl-L-alanyl-D-glutamate--2,6-diaminopimelate ligase [Clostridia bacterium]
MVKLFELMQGIDIIDTPKNLNIEIKGVAIDSREVKEGDLFICIRGKQADGHEHVLEAEMLGASAVIAERDVITNLPTIKVTNSRRAYSKIAQNYYNNPILSMKFVTVVGTNGKTSTSVIIEHLLSSAGYKTGLIGTLGYKILDKMLEADLTTPDPMQLNRLFHKMKQAGVEIVIAEVSAHAIALDKLYGIKSDICIFTNLSQDHLDFFNTYEDYANTKLSYFSKDKIRAAIINSDDKLGREIIKQANFPFITYGIDEPSDVFAIDITNKSCGTSFIINLFDEIYEINSPLYGKHNLYNMLAAITLAKMLKMPTSAIDKSIQKLAQIEGRFNIFPHKNGKVIIDFAHTPDGLRNLLLTARSLTEGKIILVFGCGGNRDVTKRPIMGEIAGRLADIVVVTSDNPRFEEPINIINEIAPSVRENNSEVYIYESRKEAIRFAIEMAEPSDTVIIAGKGAEEYIDIKGKKLKYSDTCEVKSVLRGEQ